MAESDIKDITERVERVVIEHLNISGDLNLSASFVDDLGADSLDTVELVMAFEEEFGTSIPDDDAEKMITVQNAIDYIHKELSGAGE